MANKDLDKVNKMKYELTRALDTISGDLETARNQFDYNRHGRDYGKDAAYEFDVKMNTGPHFDPEGLANKYFGGNMEDMDFEYMEHLGREVEHFVEMLQNDQKIDWIKDYFQVGRSGGWLVLTLNDYTWSEGDVEDRYNEIESKFHDEVEDYSDEDDIDLSSIRKAFKNCMKEVKKFNDDAEKHISQLQEIKKMIPTAKEQADHNFEADLERNIGESKKLSFNKMKTFESFVSENSPEEVVSTDDKYKVADKLNECYKEAVGEAKEWSEDVHDDHTVESYMNENAALVASLAADTLKECNEDYTNEQYENALNNLKEAYIKKIDEKIEMELELSDELPYNMEASVELKRS